MNAKPHTFTIDASPMTLWKVKVVIQVVIHPSEKLLLKARRSMPGAKPTDCCAAFCRTYGQSEIFKTGGILAEIHYYRKGLSVGVIAHESTHAAIHLLWICKLDLNTEKGEEAFADSVEHLVGGTVWNVKRVGMKVG